MPGRQAKPCYKQTRCLLPVMLLLALLLSACSPQISTQMAEQVQRVFPSIVTQTMTPFQPVGPSPTATLPPTATPTPTLEPPKELLTWLDPSVPEALARQISLPVGGRTVDSLEAANLHVGAIRGGGTLKSTWVYALVAPFPTVTDEVSIAEVQRAWRGEPGETFHSSLLIAPTTRAAFEALWGPPAGGRVETMPADQLLNTAWANRSSWAIVPFEAIETRWKVLRVEGQSPLDQDFNVSNYPLAIWFGVTGSPDSLTLLERLMGDEIGFFPATNRDTSKMTSLVMTGVTALVRATAHRMDVKGITYPALDIQDWLRNADLTHISNEVSFSTQCPPGDPFSTSMRFCSRPEYIGLLDFIGTDIVELSGNHNNDTGRQWSTYSLELYQERGWHTFAGGANLEEARKPALVEHNGNRLAFIGCNPVGPPNAWATASEPGAAPCENYQWMLEAITRLRSEGYLPIVTFQYHEVYVTNPLPIIRKPISVMQQMPAP
jgi:hypothetical protein